LTEEIGARIRQLAVRGQAINDLGQQLRKLAGQLPPRQAELGGHVAQAPGSAEHLAELLRADRQVLARPHPRRHLLTQTRLIEFGQKTPSPPSLF
jgi:ABC-type transporter Mla subunit MlaD